MLVRDNMMGTLPPTQISGTGAQSAFVSLSLVHVLHSCSLFGVSRELPVFLHNDAVDNPVSVGGTMGRVLDVLWAAV